MEVIIKGGQEEIAALVLAVQERREKEERTIAITGKSGKTAEERAALADAIGAVMAGKSPEGNQLQPPDATEHTQS